MIEENKSIISLDNLFQIYFKVSKTLETVWSSFS